MTYSTVFGGETIFPSQLTFLALAPTANVTLQWPTEVALPGANVLPDILEVAPAAGLSLTLPDARLAGPGQSLLVNNVGANTISVLDAGANVIGSVASGQVWEFYLQSNTTLAGTWRTFQYGTGASSAVAAALAGAGLKAITTTLNLKVLPRSDNVSPLAIVDADRARAVLWTGGVGTGTLLNPATLGTDWFVYLRNAGTGTWTITPAAGTVDGQATLALPPANSCLLFTDGSNFYTIGLTRTSATGFDFTSINVAGTGTYTLTGSELNRIAYRFTGIITGARNIVTPNTVQQYWVSNATTGAFALQVKTAAGFGVVVPSGAAMLLYCDGTDVVAAEGAPTTGLIPTDIGGTGLPTYAQGDLIYATAAQVLARLAKNTSATRYLSNTGASNAPAWAQVDLTNGVTGLLPFANIASLSALSVFGRSGNTAGVGGDITGSANQVLRVNSAGTVLGFGQVNLAAAAAVTGTLPNGNGGTDQITVSQGDLLYGIGGPAWARLAKHTTFKRPLMNTGSSNAPAWNPLAIFVQTPLSASYTLDIDDAWVLQYESSGTTIIEIPTNASVAFEIGTIIPIVNGAGAGNMTIDNLGGVTLYVKGASVSSFVLPPGYNAILWKMNTNVWSLFTDAPAAVGTDAVYAGYVGSDGTTGNSLPAGWSASRSSAGVYTVTHNLGLAAGLDLSVSAMVVNSSGNTNAYGNGAPGTNSFGINTVNSGTGALTDQAFSFIAKRNV